MTAQRQTPDGGADVSVLGPESLILLAPALEEITVVAVRTAASAVGRALGPSGNIFGRIGISNDPSGPADRNFKRPVRSKSAPTHRFA